MARNRIVTEIRADSAQMRTEFARAQRKVGEFSSGVKSATKTLVGLGAGFIGIRAGLGIFTDLSEKFDRVGKLSSRFNLPVEEIQKLSIASELTGTNIERMTAALTKATVSGVKASNGLATYSRAFADLNIDLDEFNQADASEKISLLARSFSEAENESVAFTAAYRILGKAGADLIPLLRENADGIDRLSGNLKTLSEDDVKAIEQFNDEMALLKANLQAELAKAFAGSMSEVRDEIVAVGQGLVKTTAFLIKHADALKLLIGAWAAYKGLKVTAGIIAGATAFVKSRLAITAETAALAKNTAAHTANAGARRRGAAAGSGRGGKAGAVGAGLTTAYLGYQAGTGIGNYLAANFMDDGPMEMRSESEDKKRAALLLQEEQTNNRLAEQAEVDAKNLEWRRQLLKENAAEQAKIAAARAQATKELQAELNTLAAGVLETELGYKTANQQLDHQQEKLKALTEQAREYSKASGLSPDQNLDSGATIELARQAASEGRLKVAKQLLQLAEQMQSKKAEILTLEEGIKAENDAQKAALAAKNQNDQQLAKSQKEALRAQAQEVAVLKLKAAGRGAEAEALQKEITLRREAKQIAAATGLDEANALKLARQKNELKLKEQAGENGNLDNRFDEDGNRKMARDGRRKKIVLIRRDADGNRIDGAANNKLRQAAKRLGEKNNPILPKTDRLIELAERQLTAFEKLQTSS